MDFHMNRYTKEEYIRSTCILENHKVKKKQKNRFLMKKYYSKLPPLLLFSKYFTVKS